MAKNRSIVIALKKLIRSRRHIILPAKRSIRLLGIVLVSIASIYVVIVLILAGYSYYWTGFGDYLAPHGETQRGKTLWDWMDLLIVPLALVLAAFWFNRQERKAERELASQRELSEQQMQIDRLRGEALQAYLDQMTNLLLENGLRDSAPDDEVRQVARVRTLTTLQVLDGERKGMLLGFLFEAQLISKEAPVIDLNGANLSEARPPYDLSNANLVGVHLEKAWLRLNNLSGTNLSESFLEQADLRDATLKGANLSGADLTEAKLWGADLRDVDLTDCFLIEAELRGADMRRANLAGADLSFADLSDTNLEGAILADDQLRYVRSLANAIMPDGTTRCTEI